jgi:hypothetical protein
LQSEEARGCWARRPRSPKATPDRRALSSLSVPNEPRRRLQ